MSIGTDCGLFQKLIRSDKPESPKALVLYQSASILGLSALALAATSSIHIYKHGDIGQGAVAALVGVMLPLAGLAGFHRQSDPISPSTDGTQGDAGASEQSSTARGDNQ